MRTTLAHSAQSPCARLTKTLEIATLVVQMNDAHRLDNSTVHGADGAGAMSEADRLDKVSAPSDTHPLACMLANPNRPRSPQFPSMCNLFFDRLMRKTPSYPNGRFHASLKSKVKLVELKQHLNTWAASPPRGLEGLGGVGVGGGRQSDRYKESLRPRNDAFYTPPSKRPQGSRSTAPKLS